ncbi:L,D-transpeptidase ErfK/SrfK [Natronocella acetinitrilica]|uniref:L,D-transpeptidase ErfK/SrfK n=1 Tax=Natronocella acetinitrilica TaxID=414046 RepID=A0AAE3G5I8_9GAMM|nr:L,D-transpeptidase family protein [Natronocella acetinitrilica]MCP1676246.1 L,D-transpeptidase ErfK/SrfK [Natronocella acetinitrilica]
MKRRHACILLAGTVAAPSLLISAKAVADDQLEGADLEGGEDVAEVVMRNVYPLPPRDVDVIGEVQVVRARREDTVLDIGRRYGIGFEAMRMANPGIDLWIPGEGTEIVVPTRFILPPVPREGLVINLPEMRMFYYPAARSGQARVVETYAISIGRQDWATPVGTTRVTNRIENPVWYPPASVRERVLKEDGIELPRRVEPGPDNPLGDYAIGLDIPGYFIHGTNRPYGVGMRASAGCIRMYPEDIASLVYRLPVGTAVRIINEPYKAGWMAGDLFVQAFPALEEERAKREAERYSGAVRTVARALENRPGRISYDRLKSVVEGPNGMLVRISRDTDTAGLAERGIVGSQT